MELDLTHIYDKDDQICRSGMSIWLSDSGFSIPLQNTGRHPLPMNACEPKVMKNYSPMQVQTSIPFRVKAQWSYDDLSGYNKIVLESDCLIADSRDSRNIDVKR